jgi:uncharacterized protein
MRNLLAYVLRWLACASVLLVGLHFFSVPALAQAPDPSLLAEIQKIKAIDNHSHVPKVVGPGERDDDFDALPCDPLEPTMANMMGRPENPQYVAAWRSLWGYKYNDMSPEHVREVLAAKQRIKQQQGDNYPAWVLDHLGIESELANRVAMGRGLNPPRFRWVPYEDALLIPLNAQNLAAETPDRKIFYAREEHLLKRYTADVAVNAPPARLDEYLNRVVTPTLERHKRQGAVAFKFEAAYLRSLDFEPATQADAAAIYQNYAGGEPPSIAEYHRLQDYLFRFIAAEAGRLGLPIHIHTGAGCGGYFKLSGANPLMLESVLDDPALRHTNFVLIHTGWPFTKQMAFLLMKPNVYTDYSEVTALLSARKLSEILRDFLEWYPEKVLFGTDLAPATPEIDWEEIGWQESQNGRVALAIALTGMMHDGEISRARASELARMVLRKNAQTLYHWK